MFSRPKKNIECWLCQARLVATFGYVALAGLLAWLLILTIGCAAGGNTKATAHDARDTTRESIIATGSTADTLSAQAGSCLPARRDLSGSTLRIERTTESGTRDRGNIGTPPTGSQIFGLWLGKFSAVALIVVAGIIFLCPSLAAGFFLRRAIAFKRAFSETVAGIEHATAAKPGTELAATLKAAQTPETRAMVKRARADA